MQGPDDSERDDVDAGAVDTDVPVDPQPASDSEEAAASDGVPAASPDEADVKPADAETAQTPSADVEAEAKRRAEHGPIEETPDDSGDLEMDWYILKVQSNRENSICDALRRRVAVAGLDDHFDEIMIPTEDVAEFKNGKKRVVKRKLYPGYIVVHMAIDDETWFLVRETPGIGDFTGSAGKPSPMLPHEVERIVRSSKPDEEGGEPIKTAIPFKMDDRVRIKEGTFENFEGDVGGIDEANGRVTVMINIFGRSTPVELEHWQIESV
jgi:transcriptional antiterminator NusG